MRYDLSSGLPVQMLTDEEMLSVEPKDAAIQRTARQRMKMFRHQRSWTMAYGMALCPSFSAWMTNARARTAMRMGTQATHPREQAGNPFRYTPRFHYTDGQ